MAIGVYFAPNSMSEAQYNEAMKRLTAAGAANPKGRTYHSCLGTGDKLQVFDVWDSQADFDAFGQTLMPILAQISLDPGEPQVMPVVNIVKP